MYLDNLKLERKKQLEALQKLGEQIRELETSKIAKDFRYVFETESGILLSNLQKRNEEIGKQMSMLNIESDEIAGKINLLKIKTAKESGLLKNAEWELIYYPTIQASLRCKRSDVCDELRKLFEPTEHECFALTENCFLYFTMGELEINIRRPFSIKGLIDLIKTLDINVIPSREMVELVSKQDKKVEETREIIEELKRLNQ